MANYCGNAFEGFMDQIHKSQNATGGGLSMDRFFLRLQRMLEKKARVYWNKWYFQKYLDDQIAPWGLRIQIFPTVSKLEPDFRTNWETNLQLCSMKMMELLCGHYNDELISLDKEIEKLYTENSSIVSSELFSSRESNLKTHIETYVADILKTKEKKFLRDKVSYDNNQAYAWTQNKTNKRRNTKMRTPRDVPSESNDSDTSSASSLSSQAQEGSKDFGSSKRTNGSGNAPIGSSKRHQNINRTPIHTRAITAKINNPSHALGHRDTLSNTHLSTPSPQTMAPSNTNTNESTSQSDFRPAPIFTQPVHESKKITALEGLQKQAKNLK